MTVSADFFRSVIEALESLEIPYFVTGSLATAWFGEPRLTLDVDIVVEILTDKVDAICQKFPAPEFYCSPTAVREAVQRRRKFNIIQPASGWKADIVITKNSDFDKSRFERRRRVSWNGIVDVWFSSPEDVIVKKLDFFREGNSEKHLRDIAGVLKIQGPNIDVPYIESWIQKLNLQDEWRLVKDQLDSHRK